MSPSIQWPPSGKPVPFRRLPVPTGFYAVTAGAMNDSGEVAAISMIYRKARPAYTRIVLYDRQSHLTDVGTLDPKYDDPNTTDAHKMRGVFQGALCLNNRGTLSALVDEDALVRHADGSVLTVGSGIILDINDRDAAVGFSNEMITNAVLWPSINGSQKPQITPLLPRALATATSASDGRLSLTQSAAECLNDDQKAVIAVSTQMSSNTRQLGHITYYLSDNGKLRLIASMRGVQHDHIRINNAGDAVGFEDYDTDVHAFVPILFHRGKLYDLRPVAATDGWTITSARDINDKGQILAYGYRGEGSELESPPSVPLLLTPQ